MEKTKKDSYREVMEELEKYYEGTPPINANFAFDTCACNHEKEHHICDENCAEQQKTRSNKRK